MKDVKVKVITTGQRVEVTIKDVCIIADIDENHIEIRNTRGNSNFIFKSSATQTSVVRWSRILKALKIAVEKAGEVLKERNKKS